MFEDFAQYPLRWPQGWNRTPDAERQTARFGRFVSSPGGPGETRSALTFDDALRRADIEADLTNDMVGPRIFTDVPVFRTGRPKSRFCEPGDPGAVLYWRT